jgi:4-alpha-glucanotransferase
VTLVKITRSSGILLHITSLPGRFGIGDLGPESRNFADFLVAAKQKLWSVLPLTPTGDAHSPYQCRSAFAGNPLLISPELLVEHGYIARKELRTPPKFPCSHVNFPEVARYKKQLLEIAFRNFSENKQYRAFEKKQASWLDSYALFMSLREANRGACWTEFDPQIPASPHRIRYHKFVQYEFSRQWHELRKYCARQKLAILGDLPFYLEHDSSDVWSNQHLFDLQKNGLPRMVGGVPPDYFSKDGQLWGTPVYRWDRMARTGFRWWINRLRSTLEMVDLLRLDHFRGFEAFWRVHAGASTARKGRWVKGPGARLFENVRKELGELPFVAENLGTITPEVEELRLHCGFPGMAVLQFGFDEAGTHRPPNYVPEQVCFTGTHDNDTTVGWWRSLRHAVNGRHHTEQNAILHRAQTYFQSHGRDIHWSFIQAIFTSVARIAIVPLQDVLGLGSEARMNFPGRADGNWGWRFQNDQITSSIVKRLRDLTVVSGR